MGYHLEQFPDWFLKKNQHLFSIEFGYGQGIQNPFWSFSLEKKLLITCGWSEQIHNVLEFEANCAAKESKNFPENHH